jgi:uncharacterized membrane protein YgaE (UPF0421/DUF939 family)
MVNVEIPRIGMRIIKSAIAVFLCFVVDYFRNGAGIVFYSQLSALWCMQATRESTFKNAKQRMIGTFIGTAYGFLFIVLKQLFLPKAESYDYVGSLLISGMIVLVIYTSVVIKKKQASYFSCVVFLSIVVNHIGDSNPYLFACNRFLDTVIGIAIGVLINICGV